MFGKFPIFSFLIKEKVRLCPYPKYQSGYILYVPQGEKATLLQKGPQRFQEKEPLKHTRNE